MADESAWTAHDVIEIIEKRAAQIVSIYTTKPGGLYRAMEVAAVARAGSAGRVAERREAKRPRDLQQLAPRQARDGTVVETDRVRHEQMREACRV